MASVMIGRATCPECGFGSAHVKQSEKCLYRYCPECGSQHYARSERQRSDLMAKTRRADGGGAPAPATGSEPTPATAPAPATAAPASDATPTGSGIPTPAAPVARRRGLFG